MHTRDLQPSDAPWVNDLIRERWNGPIVVSGGRCHDTRRLPGILACDEHGPAGLLLFAEDGGQIEIVTLDSLRPRQGVGRRLVEALAAYGSRRGSRRLWLVTTNDNLAAVAFYTACGFRLVAVHLDAVARARRIKPEIPLVGAGGVAIRDEFEFEKELPSPESPVPAQPKQDA